MTDNGRSVGIISEQRVNQQGSTYEAISYNLNAQHFIIDNIHAIIELNKKKATKADEKRDGWADIVWLINNIFFRFS